MYSHMMVGSDDIEKSKAFYDATFTALGGKPGIMDPKGRLIYLHNGGVFMVTQPIDGAPCSHGNGMTIGLAMDSPEQADAWHAAGAAAESASHKGSSGKERKISITRWIVQSVLPPK